jgi:hypothetical protein
MMEEISVEILEQVTEYGRLLFSVNDVAVIVGISPEKARVWLRDREHPFAMAYHRGCLLTEAEVRKTTITLAKQGSTPAAEQVKKYIRDRDVNNAQ